MAKSSMVKIMGWRMLSDSLRPDEDIKTEFTIKNLNAFRSLDAKRLALVAGDPDDDSEYNDEFFEVSMSEEFDLHLERRGSQNIEFTLEIKAKKTLAELPETKVIRLVQVVDEETGEFMVLNSIEIKIPIDPYIVHLKSLPKMRVLLWGQVGSGKSSIVNSISTVFNLDPDVAHEVVIHDSLVRGGWREKPPGKLQYWEVGNMTIYDTWGLDRVGEEGSNYSSETFTNILRGTWGDGTTMDQAEAGDGVPGDGEPVDIALFVMTPQGACDYTVRAKYIEFMQIAAQENIKVMVALTQVDTIDESLRENPYTDPDVEALVERVADEAHLVAGAIVPVVNYTREYEKEWGLTRANFVLLWRLFFTAGKAVCSQ